MDIHEQPTEPWHEDGQPGWQVPPSEPSPHIIETIETGQSRKGLSRRKLLAGLAGAGVATIGGGIALEQWMQHGGWSGPSSLSMHAQIGHLLRKAGFGLSADEVATYSSLSFNDAVNRLINYQNVSDDTLETRLKSLNLDLNKPQDQQRWWLLRMAWTQRPLLEKMTLFWHGYLTSSFRKVGGPRGYMRMVVQNNFLRNHAFDTFDNLLSGITSDPAMLIYLDLAKSTRKAPNENYARELMELFTLGLGHYTQQDVYEGAAALTGWHVRGTDTVAHYLPRDHANREIVYLGQRGNFDYKDIIHILTNHPATPWFLCRKLFTFFCYENPDNDDIKPLVDTYIKSNHSIGEVMKTLLLLPQFSSEKAYRSRIKSPTEFVIGAYRALNIESDGKELPYQTTILGQTLFDPPNVAGWPGDKTSSTWLNSGTWMARLNYINLLLLGGRSRTSTYKGADLQSIIDTNHITTPEQFVDYFASFLLDGKLDSDRKGQLVEYFKNKSGAARGKQVTLNDGTSYPLSNVRGTLYLLMASPEYQLN